MELAGIILWGSLALILLLGLAFHLGNVHGSKTEFRKMKEILEADYWLLPKEIKHDKTDRP